MTTRVRFCLSYASLTWIFFAFTINITSLRKRFVDTDVVNDVTSTVQYTSKCYYTCGHTIFMTRRYPLNRATSYKNIWRKSHRSQITLSAEGISDNIARQVKLTPDAFGSLRHVRRIHQVAAFEKCPQARKKD